MLNIVFFFSEVGVVSMRFDSEFETTCGSAVKVQFLAECTAALNSPQTQCYDCYEGSTIVIFTGNVDDLQLAADSIIEDNGLEVEGFNTLPYIDIVDTRQSSLDQIEASGGTFTTELQFSKHIKQFLINI